MIGWLIVFSWFGISVLINNPDQIKRDNAFIKNEINPNITTIDSFKSINHRLPSESEFDLIKNGTSGNLGRVSYIKDKRSENYVLSIWRGEWWESYNSANRRYDTNGTTKSNGIFALIEMTIIGLIPFAIWFFSSRRKKAVAA